MFWWNRKDETCTDNSHELTKLKKSVDEIAGFLDEIREEIDDIKELVTNSNNKDVEVHKLEKELKEKSSFIEQLLMRLIGERQESVRSNTYYNGRKPMDGPKNRIPG